MSYERLIHIKQLRYLSVFVVLFIAAVLTVILYYVKIKAQSARDEAAGLERLVEQEREAINVLKAEIALLESPQRLQQLAQDELGFVKISVDQHLTAAQLAEAFPLQSGAAAGQDGSPADEEGQP